MNESPAANQPASLLVIGYGNTLRRDDGVGPKVADAIAAMKLPAVCSLACHQLTPELAGTISQRCGVVFVDAAMDAKSEVVELREIQPADAGQIFAHATDPCSLLALARQVYGHCPRAWSLAIPVEDLGFGDGLSALAEAGYQAALKQVLSLAESVCKS